MMVARMIVEVLRVSLNLLRVSRAVKPTHVLLPDFEATLRNLPTLLWLRLRGVRIVARMGNAPSTGRFYRLLWRWVLNPAVDRFVANSDFTRRELVAHGVSAGKIETITNIAPRGRGAPVDQPRVPGRVVFVGQIIPEKGLDLLLEAIALVRAGGVDATLDVVGDVDGWEAPAYHGYRASVRERANAPDLAGAIQYLGRREDVPAVMARASVHCCPSRPEHLGHFTL